MLVNLISVVILLAFANNTLRQLRSMVVIGGWKHKKAKQQKAVAREETTDLQKVQRFLSEVYSCSYDAYGIIIAVMSLETPAE